MAKAAHGSVRSFCEGEDFIVVSHGRSTSPTVISKRHGELCGDERTKALKALNEVGRKMYGPSFYLYTRENGSHFFSRCVPVGFHSVAKEDIEQTNETTSAHSSQPEAGEVRVEAPSKELVPCL